MYQNGFNLIQPYLHKHTRVWQPSRHQKKKKMKHAGTCNLKAYYNNL